MANDTGRATTVRSGIFRFYSEVENDTVYFSVQNFYVNSVSKVGLTLGGQRLLTNGRGLNISEVLRICSVQGINLEAARHANTGNS